MNKFLAGALAGCVATGPMTLAMVLLHRQLPWHERHPLPPKDITTEITERIGIREDLSEPQHDVVAWVSHFGFGTVAGALYAPVSEKVEAPPALKGAAFGLAVWAASYLGWLPAIGILHQTAEQPTRPNLMTIFAHLIWGITLGVLAERWESAE